MEIRPVSDLRNNFTEISKTVHESKAPVFLTKNGYGDMVVMSLESYTKLVYDNELYIKLKEAALESKSTNVRYTHDEVINGLRNKLGGN